MKQLRRRTVSLMALGLLGSLVPCALAEKDAPKPEVSLEHNTAFEIDPVADAPQSVSGLRNDPARGEEFMDWGMGMFIHWSLDSELGSVISHSMVGASDDYLDRFVHELPKYFDPRDYDPEAWAKLAKLAGFKYMVLMTKHHSGFCLWPTKTTAFSIAQTPYQRDIVRAFVDACRKYDMKVGFYFSPEDFLFMHRQGHDITRNSEHANVSTNPGLLAHAAAQIKELFTNSVPSMWPFWTPSTTRPSPSLSTNSSQLVWSPAER